MRPLEWTFIQSDWCLQKKTRFGDAHRQREDRVKNKEKTANPKPTREASEETKLAGCLSSSVS